MNEYEVELNFSWRIFAKNEEAAIEQAIPLFDREKGRVSPTSFQVELICPDCSRFKEKVNQILKEAHVK